MHPSMAQQEESCSPPPHFEQIHAPITQEQDTAKDSNSRSDSGIAPADLQPKLYQGKCDQ
jgi:hypothetical protein